MAMSPSAGPGIRYETTPNPNALKFTLDQTVVASGSRSFASRFEAAGDPLSSALFEITGLVGVFCMADFVTVTKDPAAAWEDLVPAIAAAIRSAVMNHE
jgi:NFU1 iron-sulfur cluster scaffold homolog, mitochondrial